MKIISFFLIVFSVIVMFEFADFLFMWIFEKNTKNAYKKYKSGKQINIFERFLLRKFL